MNKRKIRVESGEMGKTTIIRGRDALIRAANQYMMIRYLPPTEDSPNGGWQIEGIGRMNVAIQNIETGKERLLKFVLDDEDDEDYKEFVAARRDEMLQINSKYALRMAGYLNRLLFGDPSCINCGGLRIYEDLKPFSPVRYCCKNCGYRGE